MESSWVSLKAQSSINTHPSQGICYLSLPIGSPALSYRSVTYRATVKPRTSLSVSEPLHFVLVMTTPFTVLVSHRTRRSSSGTNQRPSLLIRHDVPVLRFPMHVYPAPARYTHSLGSCVPTSGHLWNLRMFAVAVWHWADFLLEQRVCKLLRSREF